MFFAHLQKERAAQPVRYAAFDRMGCCLCYAQRLQGWLINRRGNR
jgi:hypothetical protein